MRSVSLGLVAGLLVGVVACGDDSAAGGDAGADGAPDGPGFADECALGTDDCAADAVCTDTPDAFTCTCRVGYEGDGRTCTITPLEQFLQDYAATLCRLHR